MGLTSLLLATLFVAPPVPAEPDPEPGMRQDAFGDALPFGAVARYGTLRYRAGFPARVAFSRDGKTLISAGAGNKLHFWETATGKLVHAYEAFSSYNHQFAVSSDGKQVVTGNANDKALTLRDLGTGKVLRRLEGLHNYPGAIRISPDGKFVAASVPQSGEVIVWDKTKGKVLTRMTSIDGYSSLSSYSITFSQDGKYLAAGNRKVLIFDLAMRSPASLLQRRAGTIGANAIAFSPDSSRVTTAGEGVVRLWDRADEKEIRRVETDIVERFILTRDGKIAFGNDKEDRLTAWSVETGKRIFRSSTRVRANGFALSHDENSIVKWNFSTIALHDARTGKCLTPIPVPEYPFSLAFSPDGKFLALANFGEYEDLAHFREYDIRLWGFRAGVVVPQPRTELRRPWLVSVNDRREILLYAIAPEAGISMWNLTTKRKIAALPREKGGYQAIFTKGKAIVMAGDEVIEWNTSANRIERRIPLPEDLRHPLLLLSDDDRVLLTSRFGAAATWDAVTGKRLSMMTFPRDASPRAISPDGKRFVTAGEEGTHLRDSQTGKVVLDFGGKNTQGVAFSPDGRLIAVADGPGAFQLWDAKTLKKLRRLEGHRGIVSRLIFSPDSRYLASVSLDTTVLVWDVRKLARRGGRNSIGSRLGER